jgi:CubicO group peptidase (beta-lactamase class C family)
MSHQSSVTTKLILSWLAMIVMALISGLMSSAHGQPSDASGVTAVEADLQGPTDPVEFEAFLDVYLTAQMEEHQIPGVVFTMVKDGEVFFSKGYGYADLEAQTPFDPEETVLTTASLAKAFAALGVLQLYEQGIIDLDEDIRPYFTDFQLDTAYDEPLTFAHLLTHTDGFEMRMIGGGALSEDALLPLGALLETYMPPQIYPPGKYMTYSDFASNLAGYATAEITGIPFEQYMAENIYVPGWLLAMSIRMVSTSACPSSSPAMAPQAACGLQQPI